MRIVLGTAQFGLDYGLANSNGRVREFEVRRILARAIDLGVDTLDTATAYGETERILGEIGISRLKVITKIAKVNDWQHKSARWVGQCIEESLERLQCAAVYGLLLHRPLDLVTPNGFQIYEALVDAKRQGLISKFGVSVYGPEELDRLDEFKFDLVQAPMSVLDRRLKNSGWLERLVARGTEIHVRSAFLQGLLLMAARSRPAYFSPWHDLLSDYDTWVEQHRMTKLQGCLGFLNANPEIDGVVVGVDNVEQLQNILAAANRPTAAFPERLQSSDSGLINPTMWEL